MNSWVLMFARQTSSLSHYSWWTTSHKARLSHGVEPSSPTSAVYRFRRRSAAVHMVISWMIIPPHNDSKSLAPFWGTGIQAAIWWEFSHQKTVELTNDEPTGCEDLCLNAWIRVPQEKNALMNIKIVRKWMLIPNEMVLLALSRIGGTQGGGEHTKI